MRKLTLTMVFFILAMNVIAQVANPELQLADSIKQATPEWVDLDNDGLLDILLLMKSETDKSFIGVIKGDTLNPLSKFSATSPIIDFRAYLLADYNRDNAMDIVISGEKNGAPATVIYINKGNFSFEEKIITTVPAFNVARLADLDDDAIPEFVISGENDNGYYVKILKQLSEDLWTTVHDSLQMKCSAIEVLDADGDGTMDLFVSGRVKPDSMVSGFLMNANNFYFKSMHTVPLAGTTSTGDFNNDGFFEVILMAQDKNEQWHTKKFQHNSEGYNISDLSTVLQNGHLFIADFDYDGVADINFLGLSPSGDTVNMILYRNGENLLLPTDGLTEQRFGDIEHDGDLDLLLIKNNGRLSASFSDVLIQAKNLAPGNPLHAVALPVFNRIFMYWDKPADDRTPKESLTYDVFLNGAQNYQAGEFDLLNEKRLTVTHGNNGTNNFKLLKNISPSELAFSIQSIDNSFHAGTVCVGGAGIGIGLGPCATVTTEEIVACTNENLVFEAPANALWFSFADGFLGKGTDFEFASHKPDTLFYYSPLGESCSSLKAWAVKINDDTFKIENTEKYACLNSSLEFKVEPGWERITWSSHRRGNLGTDNPITFNVTEPDSVFARITNSGGCQILRKTALKISKPEISVAADHYKIIKGASVQLQASGSQRYTWAPNSGLSEADIPNPVASPTSSTQYVVTGYDSLGCQAQDSVSVLVEEMGFIPNLFSPNADGQNDQLKIYGLVSAQQFSFRIYDREGALVYKTSDLSEAVRQGWDGTRNGTAQPAGIYFWKVEGELSSGPLRLNGKDAGSIVLIR
jgi:gliding motility-associated-like protein